MRAMPTMLFILGMHRSGTSALAGSLEILGGTVPAHRVPAEAHNPKGHFEPADVVEANDALLQRLGRTWSSFSPVPVPKGPAARADADALAAILSSAYPGAELAVVKDPRLSALFPLWAGAAEGLGFRIACLIPVRPPMQSAHSLLRRDGMPLTHGIALWLRSMLDSERHTRGLDRAFVDPDALIRTPVAELSRVGNLAGLAWPRSPQTQANALEGFLDRSLLHDAEPTDDSLLPVADDIYDAFRALLSDPRDPPSLARLDAARHAFDAYSPTLERWMQLADELVLSLETETEGRSPSSNANALIQTVLRRREGRDAERQKREVEAQALERVLDSLRLDRDLNLSRVAAAIEERDKALSVIAALQTDRDHNVHRASAAIAERDKAVAEFQRILADCKAAEARAAERDHLIRTLEITVRDQQQALERLTALVPDGPSVAARDDKPR